MTSTPDSTVKLLIEIIGEAAALRMMDENFGGMTVEFPKKKSDAANKRLHVLQRSSDMTMQAFK
jgi:hypothetical protein